MFGYHDSNRCYTDLWSPVTSNQYDKNADPHQPGYGVWEDTPYHTAVENRAFSAYAFYSEYQPLEDIIVALGTKGTVSYNGILTAGDKQYIIDEVYRRYGFRINFS